MNALSQLKETSRAVQILRQTLERRTPPDAVIDNALTAIEGELEILASVLETDDKRRK